MFDSIKLWIPTFNIHKIPKTLTGVRKEQDLLTSNVIYKALLANLRVRINQEGLCVDSNSRFRKKRKNYKLKECK